MYKGIVRDFLGILFLFSALSFCAICLMAQ